VTVEGGIPTRTGKASFKVAPAPSTGT
jgi:hypothetical protein